MRIAVYAGAADGKNSAFLNAARELGTWMAKNGHTLVYGAGKVGMMGEVVNTVLEAGGSAIGVIPQFLYDLYGAPDGLSELIITKDMSERKCVMSEKSDVAIALPGGSGTIEEITEAFSWSRLFVNRKPCILYNTDDFYKGLYMFYEKMVEEEFLEKEAMTELLLSDDVLKIEKFIEQFEIERKR